MSNHVSHAALPFPVKHARYTVVLPFLDADGDPTDPTTPDTEVSGDGGAFADCAEEVTTISGTATGSGYITLTGAETNYSIVALAAKAASGPKTTLATLLPRVLPIIASGTASAGAASSLTIPSTMLRKLNYWNGIIIRTTGGTGGGGTGGANNQARIVTASTESGVLSVEPNWETTPDNTTTFDLCGSELWVGAKQDLAVASGLVYGPVTAVGGSTTTVTLPANSFATDDSLLVGGLLLAIAGTGVGQGGVINAFNAGTEVATLDETQSIAFDSTTQFIVLAGSLGLTSSAVATAVRTEMDANSTGLAKLGTPVSSVSADIAVVKAFVDTEIADIQARLPAALTGAGHMKADAIAISGDTNAADNLESAFDGTGGVVFSVSHTAAERTAQAVALLGTGIDATGVSARTVRQALALNRNKISLDPTTGALIVYDTDDTTVLWTGTGTFAASARNALQTMDPA